MAGEATELPMHELRTDQDETPTVRQGGPLRRAVAAALMSPLLASLSTAGNRGPEINIVEWGYTDPGCFNVSEGRALSTVTVSCPARPDQPYNPQVREYPGVTLRRTMPARPVC